MSGQHPLHTRNESIPPLSARIVDARTPTRRLAAVYRHCTAYPACVSGNSSLVKSSALKDARDALLVLRAAYFSDRPLPGPPLLSSHQASYQGMVPGQVLRSRAATPPKTLKSSKPLATHPPYGSNDLSSDSPSSQYRLEICHDVACRGSFEILHREGRRPTTGPS